MCEPSIPHLRQLMRHVVDVRRRGVTRETKQRRSEADDQAKAISRSSESDGDNVVEAEEAVRRRAKENDIPRAVVDVKRTRREIVARFSRVVVAERIFQHLKNVSTRLSRSSA
jgi:hypothetical protein